MLKKYKNWGAGGTPLVKKNGFKGAPNGFKNFRRAMRIPNMCLVLKYDNGKVVSIAHEQTDTYKHRQTDGQSHPAPY